MDGERLIERRLRHVAVDDVVQTVSLEIAKPTVLLGQHIVGEGSVKTVANTPVIHIGSLSIDGFEVHVHTTCILIILQDITGSCITEAD